jgi:YbbR domain-containing protein
MRLAPSVRNNAGLKTLSLALALLLWSFVHGTKIVERPHSIPIHYENLPDSLMFVDPPPDEMRVVLEGPAQDLLLRLRFMRDVVARIDLSSATAGMDRAWTSISQIDAPANERVSVIRILSPSVIALNLSERDEKTLPLRVVLDELPEGYCLVDSPLAIPSEVVCRGPRRLLRDTSEIATLPFELPKKRGRLVSEAEIALPHPSIECDAERVQVALRMERLAEVTLEQHPLTIVPPASAELWVAADIGFAKLTVAGPEPRMTSLDPTEFGLFLDTSQLDPGRYDQLEIVWDFPPWAQLVRIEPSVVGVTVHFDPEGIGRAVSDSSAVQVP